MTAEKKVWWKRFGLWVAAGVSAAVALVLFNERRKKEGVVIPMPQRPEVPPVIVPDVNTSPATTYESEKVVPVVTGDKSSTKKILERLRNTDPKVK